jgi:hypothetical protein
MFKHSYLKVEKPSPPFQKKEKASNSILDQIRIHSYTSLAQSCFLVYQHGSFIFCARFIIFLMSNAEYYELLLDKIVAQLLYTLSMEILYLEASSNHNL